jgi:hypothetical protein
MRKQHVNVVVQVDRTALDKAIAFLRPNAPLSASEERMLIENAAVKLLKKGYYFNLQVEELE